MEIVTHFYQNDNKKYVMHTGNLQIILLFVMEWGDACKFRIQGPSVLRTFKNIHGEEKVIYDTSQAIYLPTKCLHLISETQLASQDWFWNKGGNKHKLRLAGYEI